MPRSPQAPPRWRSPNFAVLIAWACATAVAVVFSALVAPHIYHVRGWWIFGDLSTMLRLSAVAASGGLAHIYGVALPAPLVAFPGFEEILAVVLKVLHPFGLVFSVGSVLVRGQFVSLGKTSLADHLIIVVAFALGTSAIIPADALARDLGAKGAIRGAFLVITGLTLVWAVALWGHPDDALAVGLLAAALRSAIHGRWRASAWLLGGAFAVQPMVILGAFIVLGTTALPATRWSRFICRVAIIPVLALAVPLIGSPRTTLHHVVEQPVQWGSAVATNHVTPWHVLALHQVTKVFPSGLVFHEGSGGDVRLLAVVLAVALGVWVARRDRSVRLESAVWALGLAFTGRILFEAVVVPYYLLAPVLFAMVAIALRHQRWLPAGGALSVVVVWAASSHGLGEWGYLATVGGGLLVLCAMGWPGPVHSQPQPETGQGEGSLGSESSARLTCAKRLEPMSS